ncbi:Lcl C-terminal domain-containing protein [Kaarinaea lacus]
MIRSTSLLVLYLWFSPVAFAQSCVDSITPTTGVRDYAPNASATVVNRNHRLMWSRCALGQTWQAGKCTGEPLLKTWEEAQALAKDSSLHTFRNWRLPSIHELSGITELSCQNPAINLELFPNAPSVSFWTATLFVNDNNLAWQVFFGSGENHTAKKSTLAAIRLVRSMKDEEDF